MSDENVVPDTLVKTRTRTKDESKQRRLPPYNVILLNDELHTAEFVVDVLQKVLGCNSEKAVLLMTEAHTSGRSIVWSGAKEVAELKQEQIQSFHEVRQDGMKLGPLGVDLEPAVG